MNHHCCVPANMIPHVFFTNLCAEEVIFPLKCCGLLLASYISYNFLSSPHTYFMPSRPSMMISQEHKHMSRESDHLASTAAKNHWG